MILYEQIELLRIHISELEQVKYIGTPLWGGGAMDAYTFKKYVLVARDILAFVSFADPDGFIFPEIKREIRSIEEDKDISLRHLLGMIVHLSYLTLNNDTPPETCILDVINDRGERHRVKLGDFISALNTLLLKPHQIGVAVCCFTDRHIKKMESCEKDKIPEMFLKHWNTATSCNFDWLLAKFCKEFSLEQAILKEIFELLMIAETPVCIDPRSHIFHMNPTRLDLGRMSTTLTWNDRKERKVKIESVGVRRLISVIRGHLELYNLV